MTILPVVSTGLIVCATVTTPGGGGASGGEAGQAVRAEGEAATAGAAYALASDTPMVTTRPSAAAPTTAEMASLEGMAAPISHSLGANPDLRSDPSAGRLGGLSEHRTPKWI